ncbi:MAG TPA: Shedu anti-phage system protein SduA domain-containing protein [Polyangiaceae bacterium]
MPRLRLASEDRFLLVRLSEGRHLLPDIDVAEEVHAVLSTFQSLRVLYDLRGAKQFTNDIWEFLDGHQGTPTVIVDPGEEDLVRRLYPGAEVLPAKRRSHSRLAYRELGIDFLEAQERHRQLHEPWARPGRPLTRDEAELCVRLRGLGSSDDRRRLLNELLSHDAASMLTEYTGPAFLRRQIKWFADVDLRERLTQLILLPDGSGKVHIQTYQGFAAHAARDQNSASRIVRPHNVACVSAGRLENAIAEFEQLLNRSDLREEEIQNFLDHQPLFLQSLGYKRAHSHVALVREEEASKLIPDFILEPLDTGWCDILDLKLPNKRVVVGNPDRRRLSAHVQELIAQLREYGAYFDSPAGRDFLQRERGLRCYRPRLIGIIGNTLGYRDPEARRALTAYSDVRLVGFDELVQLTKQRVAI